MQERHLTQQQLGELVGVQKAQISKIENSVKNARFETRLKVFDALRAKVSFMWSWFKYYLKLNNSNTQELIYNY